MLDVVKYVVARLRREPTDAQKDEFKEEKKKYYKELFLIHSCVNNDNFEKVGDCMSSNQAWKILKKAYERVDKVKVVRLQTHKRKFELVQWKRRNRSTTTLRA